MLADQPPPRPRELPDRLPAAGPLLNMHVTVMLHEEPLICPLWSGGLPLPKKRKKKKKNQVVGYCGCLRARRMCGARRESMVALLEEVEKKWGRAEGYLKEVVGLDDEVLRRLVEVMVESVEEEEE